MLLSHYRISDVGKIPVGLLTLNPPTLLNRLGRVIFSEMALNLKTCQDLLRGENHTQNLANYPVVIGRHKEGCVCVSVYIYSIYVYIYVCVCMRDNMS